MLGGYGSQENVNILHCVMCRHSAGGQKGLQACDEMCPAFISPSADAQEKIFYLG